MNPKLFTAKMIGLLAITTLVASCGTKTNPTEGYSLDGVPKGEKVNEAVGVQPGDLFFVELTSMSDAPISSMSFIEGKPASYKIKVHTVLSKASFKLTPSGLPAGVSMAPVNPSNPASDYVISGTVPVGSSANSIHGVNSTATINVTDISGDPKEVSILQASGTSYQEQLNVSPTDEVPVVEPRAPISATEGDLVPVTIVVKDLGSHDKEMPQIQQVIPRKIVASVEVTMIAANPGLTIDPDPTALGDNRFQFKATVDTSLLRLPPGTKPVTARFAVNFRSPSQMTSADEYVDIKIARKVIAEPPAIAPAANAAAPAANAASPAQNAAAPTANAGAKNLEAAKNVENAVPASNAAPATNGKNAKNVMNAKRVAKKKTAPKAKKTVAKKPSKKEPK